MSIYLVDIDIIIMNELMSFVNNTTLNSPIWIDSLDQLDQLIQVLSNETLIAVDTESDSLYSYFEKVCLIQFSTSKADYLVDPLNVDVSGLNSVFASNAIQKIFHAAEYDILSLKRDYGFEFANLFDTMIAARILGWPRYGLSTILEEHFQIKLDKRFQRYNWGQRPLDPKALVYAQFDTHYLLSLRRLQLTQLKKQHRLSEALEAFERQTQVQPAAKTFDPDDFWRIKGAKNLPPQQQSVLRELFILRDKIARKINCPPFKVMNNSVLLGLAKEQPQYIDDLKQIKGVSRKLLQYNGENILKAIQTGQTAPFPRYQQDRHHCPDNDILSRYEVLRQWRNNLAARRGVEPDVIISNNTLMNIARHNPKSLSALTRMDVLGDWQFKTYGKSLLKILNNISSQ